ncbi:hypothetical protein [Streptomyces tubercidicus]|uniref:hypothetical protein n=1 Tax=Streptomyces tubercidicus TaxID=47759 RepID=UPI002E0D9399|nr:hypothetical protein OG761_29465 [Streptomyces tubercidicus]WSX19744.1 hypothetical protein OG690_07910 [Streptomyces tubercidicus]
MKLKTLRWLLAPIHQWRTYRLMAAHGSSMGYSTAWSLVALARHPDELPYVQNAAVRSAVQSAPAAGVRVDAWDRLDPEERARRISWLNRYRATPLQRLGVPEEIIEIAGLQVVEWGLPPERDAASIVVQNRRRRAGEGE